jgi:hypothetical protein
MSQGWGYRDVESKMAAADERVEFTRNVLEDNASL